MLYVLVLVLQFNGVVKVKAYAELFESYAGCMRIAVPYEKELMLGKPDPSATADLYCLKLQRGEEV